MRVSKRESCVSAIRGWIRAIRVRRERGRFPPPASLAVQEEKEFQAILHRERARTDRNGSLFSLVVFLISPKCSESASIAASIATRVRATDSVGWMSDGIGAILPDTRPACALKLVREIQEKLETRCGAVGCKVYCYPFASAADDRTDFAQVLQLDTHED